EVIVAIRALIFDFDGTLLDTESPDMLAWQAVFEEHQVSLSLDLWYQNIGRAPGTFDVYAHLEALIERPVVRDHVHGRYRSRFLELLALETLRDGVDRWLADAHALGLDLAIASSSPRSWVTGHLTAFGLLDRFRVIRSRDDVTHTKPAPDLYLSALDGLGLQADEAIAIEDSPNGSVAAKAAGLYVIAVPNPVTRNLRFSRADLVLDSLADLSLADALARAANGVSEHAAS
ncbi:MAG TPA: HAD family hydrolase, partial [Chloroflexota bacterium]|nr:HAD family hydrolase [Chloroflexota bacterium]